MHIDELTKDQREQVALNAIKLYDYFRGLVSDMDAGDFNMAPYRDELPRMKGDLQKAQAALKPLWSNKQSEATR